MTRSNYSTDAKIIASEYGSNMGYLVREFELEAERKKEESREAARNAKEEASGSKNGLLTKFLHRNDTRR